MTKSVFLLASLSSGQGKTILTLALSEMIREKGLSLGNYKVGPDYLDTSFYNGYNLDSYFLDEETLKSFFFTTSSSYEVVIVEGVMGVYDGPDINSIQASSAHIAKILNIPVILVVSPGGSVLTVVSSLKGVVEFEKGINFKGVIFNKLKSAHHYKLLKEAVEKYTSLKVYGYLPYDADISVPQRHLGIFPSWEHSFDKNAFVKYRDYIDVDRVLKDTKISPPFYRKFSYPDADIHVNIGIAKDRAFGFYYRENIELLEHLGASIVYVSPMKDPVLPPDLDLLYIGGGYPELYMEELSENTGFIHSLRLFGKIKPIYAECGGLMYLAKTITYNKKENRMVGLFPGHIKFSKYIRGLGYREVKTKKRTLFGRKGTILKGHEFHYSYISEYHGGYVYELYKNGKLLKEDGIRLPGGGIASYTHTYFLSSQESVINMLEYARGKRNEISL